MRSEWGKAHEATIKGLPGTGQGLPDNGEAGSATVYLFKLGEGDRQHLEPVSLELRSRLRKTGGDDDT